MSGQLDLSFTHQGGSDVGELPVVVDVVDASLEAAVKPRLVQLASGWRKDLEPGTYLVRVRFPSGEEIRRTCTVRDGDHIPIFVDVRGLAGHESLERSAALRPVIRDESTPGLAGTSFAAAWVRRWRGESSREWQPIDFGGITVGGDDYAVQYRFASAQQSNLLQLGGPRIAWRFVSLPAVPVVDVTVSPRGENDLAVEVTTGSTEAEALLGYLRTGAVEGADVTAESLLQQKRRDPIAAAIGGYYLLRTANLDRLSAWGPNLSEWFPWLADGAVINGWQHIHAGREHRGDPDRHFGAARGQLILAVRRGVPVYTEGLRLLVDGLRLLREDAEAEDAELDAALTFIEPFAMAADWSAATVTYSGANPAEPNPRRRYGIPEDRERLQMMTVSREALSLEPALVRPSGFRFREVSSLTALGDRVSSVSLEPALVRPSGFVFGEVSSLTALRDRVSSVPSLGPLSAFTGTFRGSGFNTIFRPGLGSPTQLPVPVAGSDNLLELNLTQETLSFSPSLGSVPNRGEVMPDIFLNGVPYLQVISDVTVPSQPVGIHFEPGLWMAVPATTHPAEGPTVVRMASIPHGTTIKAQGTSFTINGPPTIAAVDITPFAIGQPNNKITFPSQTASNKDTARIPQDLTSFIAAGTITQAMLADPSTLLRNHIASQTITSTTVIVISTEPAAPLFGGGTDNIAFLLGDPAANNPNAQAVRMDAQFWIETVEYTIEVPVFEPGQPPLVIPAPTGAEGQPVPRFLVNPPVSIREPRYITVRTPQIQYSQQVFLNFKGLTWPHVSVATLVPASPLPVPASAFA